MNKEEAYKTHYPESPEFYKESIKDPEKDFVDLLDVIPKQKDEVETGAGKELAQIPPKPKKSHHDGVVLAIVLAFIIGVVVGALALSISDYNTSSKMNETLLNETMIEGFNIGVLAASQNILNEKLLPVFNVTDDGAERLGYYNLTECIQW